MEDESEVRIRKWLEIPSGIEDSEDFSYGSSFIHLFFQ
jgi:hypothetical protein